MQNRFKNVLLDRMLEAIEEEKNNVPRIGAKT